MWLSATFTTKPWIIQDKITSAKIQAGKKCIFVLEFWQIYLYKERIK